MTDIKLVEIFVRCDDFYKEFEKFLSAKGLNDPLKKTRFWKLPDVSQWDNEHCYFLSSGGVQVL